MTECADVLPGFDNSRPGSDDSDTAMVKQTNDRGWATESSDYYDSGRPKWYPNTYVKWNNTGFEYTLTVDPCSGSSVGGYLCQMMKTDWLYKYIRCNAFPDTKGCPEGGKMPFLRAIAFH